VVPVIDIVKAVLPVYLLMACGALLRRSGVIRRDHDDALLRLVYSVMLPCFIVHKILDAGSLVLRTAPAAIALGFFLPLAATGIGLAVGRLLGMEKGTGLRTFALASGVPNFGFTAAPTIEILWGSTTLATLFIHNLGMETMMWSVGVMLMCGTADGAWRKLLNGPMLAVPAGLLLVVCGLDPLIGKAPRTALAMLGAGAFPLGIVFIGCLISDLASTGRPAPRTIAGSLLVRFVLAPLLFLGAARFLPIPTELKQVLVVQAAMPGATSPMMLARLYGGKTAIAAQVLVFTTLASLVALPWIIAIGCRWTGLKPLLP
jgi:predicted permease